MSEATAGASGTAVPEQRGGDRADHVKADHVKADHGNADHVQADRTGADRRQDVSAHRESVEQRGERPVERADRNMVEMLQELRVAQTGVQILFAFLLSLSFTERFTHIDDFQRWTYVVTLLLTSITTGLLVAPAAIHRMLFGRGVKAATVRIGHHLFVAGLAALILTLVGAVLLVLDVAVGRPFALWSAGALGVLLVGLWFVLPLPVRERDDADGVDGDDEE